MKQVFWNLAKNALKAMPQGGTLRARARGGPEGAQVSFADSGVGMSDEEVAKSFQPFHSSFEGGSGLGLSIVYRIVQEHGGRIQVQSRPGAGTTITLALPSAAGSSGRREAQWIAS
jgi:two-component system sensor histidine kinase PilS (NtrC family)